VAEAVVVSFSLRRPNFDTESIYVVFVVGRVTLTGLSPNSSVFPRRSNSSIVPYVPTDAFVTDDISY